MPESLLDSARQAVQAALSAGADDAMASARRGRSVDFQWRDGKLEKVQENTGNSLAVALYVDGRFSRHTTNDLRPRAMADFLREAVALTRLLEPDPFRRITPAELYEGRADIDLERRDPAVERIDRDDRLTWLAELDEAARNHDDVISVTAGVQDGWGEAAGASSNGFEASDVSTGLWYGATVTIREGEHKRPEAWRWVGGLRLDGLDNPAKVGAEALRRVLDRVGSARVPTFTGTLVVDPEAGGGLLGRVLGAITGGAIQQERSFLAAHLGERIASPLLTLRDEPLLVGGMGSRLYDGEGIAARPLPLITEGVLDGCYIDTYYGRKLDMEPTTGGPSNVLFNYGPKGRDELVRGVSSGILVTSWLGGNADGTTGDFSFGLRGHRLRDGELAEPVSEMNVTGNYLDLLPRLVAVGNDPVPWSSLRVPTLVFDDVQFSGA